jgi:hypothetical protein
MLTIDAATFQRDFARYRDEADREPVTVISNGKVIGAFLSPHDLEDYARLKRLERESQAITASLDKETVTETAPLAPAEEAEAYDRWFRTKVEAALASDKPRILHDEAMARIDALIESKRRAASHLDR